MLLSNFGSLSRSLGQPKLLWGRLFLLANNCRNSVKRFFEKAISPSNCIMLFVGCRGFSSSFNLVSRCRRSLPVFMLRIEWLTKRTPCFRRATLTVSFRSSSQLVSAPAKIELCIYIYIYPRLSCSCRHWARFLWRHALGHAAFRAVRVFLHQCCASLVEPSS